MTSPSYDVSRRSRQQPATSEDVARAAGVPVVMFNNIDPAYGINASLRF